MPDASVCSTARARQSASLGAAQTSGAARLQSAPAPAPCPVFLAESALPCALMFRNSTALAQRSPRDLGLPCAISTSGTGGGRRRYLCACTRSANRAGSILRAESFYVCGICADVVQIKY